MNRIKYIYTWKDVDRIFENFNRNNNESYFNTVDVYHDEIVISLNDMSKMENARNVLEKILGLHYRRNEDIIKFDLPGMQMDVVWEEEPADKKNMEVTPLFKDVIYHDSSYDSDILNNTKTDECPVIAFHSYKGGVGRTLSLLAFVKAWTQNSDKKLLIIDSDMEAPGLTWMTQEEGDLENQISYFDILEMIQSSELEDESIYNEIIQQMQTQTVKFDNGKMNIEHFFLPTYRYEEQLLDIYASPESIAQGYRKKYILAEKISDLGKRLGAEAVLVDLRAGISEFSAPLLFDPRVKKYIVTSTSYQSIKGTQLILKEICKGLPLTGDGNIPHILLTMIMDDNGIDKIKAELLQVYDEQGQDYTDNAITELPFASELVHLGKLDNILNKLNDREMYRNIAALVKEFYVGQSINVETNISLSRPEMIKKIHELAERQINAEMNEDINVLMTQPIKNLVKKYGKSVPYATVIGAKGSGKTFLYRELLRAKKWETFCMKRGKISSQNCTYIIPLIAPKNLTDMDILIKDAVRSYKSEITIATDNENFWFENGKLLESLLAKELHTGEWKEIWTKCILNSFSSKINGSLEAVENMLAEKQINVLFVADGLEEFFENTLDRDTEKYAVRTLVQEVMNELKIQYPHIGMIAFLRKDLCNNSFVTNKEQFENQNKNYALNWTHDEALRLALWLVNQAVPGIFVDDKVLIEDATPETVREALNKLWGLKLGKKDSNEAYSYRWILAALSDFHAQLQARDIVRFLADATKEIGIETYEDRIIMPREIKKAVQTCSNKKVEEIKQEMKKLTPILSKLENAGEDEKILPFEAGAFNLTVQEEALLQQEGLLKMYGGKYYIPEIIRHALKFKYGKGARPKVLALVFH